MQCIIAALPKAEYPVLYKCRGRSTSVQSLVFQSHAAILCRFCYNMLDLLPPLLIRRALHDLDLLWESGVQHIFCANIHGDGRRYQYKHHRAQYTDVRKPYRVLLHTVQHARDGRKMPALIIKLLILTQSLKDYAAPRHEQCIRAKHYEKHRHKERHKRRQR